jgi:hypothetical protein
MHFHFCGDELAAILASVPMAAVCWLWVKSRWASIRAFVRGK